MADWDRVEQVVRNASSFRLFFSCLLAGLIVGALLSLVWRPLLYIGVALGLLGWIGAAISPETAMYCPFCRKRNKLGSSVCHHCGRDVTAS